MWKPHKIIQIPLEEYLEVKVNELSNLDGLERPTFCLTWPFRLICFTAFPTWKFLVLECAVIQNQYLDKWKSLLTLSRWRSPPYKDQSIDLLCRSMNWFLYDRDLCQERVKETDYANSSFIYSYLPFYWNSQEKQFLKKILGWKSYCITIRDKFRTLSKINDENFVQKQSTAKNCCLFLQKTTS